MRLHGATAAKATTKGDATITEGGPNKPRRRSKNRRRRERSTIRGRRARLDVRGGLVKDLTDEVITASSSCAEELFFELVDTLEKEDDPIGVACSLLVQLTRFVAEAGWTSKELSRRRDAAD